MKKLLLVLLVVGLGSIQGYAQDGETTDYTYQTFKDTRIINGNSVETNIPGQLKFIISHRFGEVNGGWRELWGIDQSTIRFGLDYGLTENITFGIGRSSFQKTFDGFAKWRFLRQSSGAKNMPLTVTYFGSVAVNSLEAIDPDRDEFEHRLYYTNQLLFARKFNEYFSLQIMPTHVHRNLVATSVEENDVFAIGSATRIQISKVVGIMAEYYYVLPDQLADGFRNSVGIGVDIETKGHVFQLHITNSRGMTERFFVTETRGDFAEGDLHLGFNISRTFVLKGRKYP